MIITFYWGGCLCQPFQNLHLSYGLSVFIVVSYYLPETFVILQYILMSGTVQSSVFVPLSKHNLSVNFFSYFCGAYTKMSFGHSFSLAWSVETDCGGLKRALTDKTNGELKIASWRTYKRDCIKFMSVFKPNSILLMVVVNSYDISYSHMMPILWI